MNYLEKMLRWADSKQYADHSVRFDMNRGRLSIWLLNEENILEIKVTIKNPAILTEKRSIRNIFGIGKKAPPNDLMPLLDLDLYLEGNEES